MPDIPRHLWKSRSCINRTEPIHYIRRSTDFRRNRLFPGIFHPAGDRALFITNNKFEDTIAKKRIRVNDSIRASQVRVVDPKGEHGLYDLEDALRMAEERDLDLVEISPNADPPVCKIMDYGKYRYEQQKKEKEARKKSHSVELKEIRFRPHTDTHDFNFKTKHARNFLLHGDKVRAYVQFRGRDIIYKDHGMDLLRRFLEELADIAKIDQEPRMEGRRMTTILTPLKKKG